MNTRTTAGAKKAMDELPASKGPQSVGRVIAILEYLVTHRQGATLSELATFAEAPKTSLVGLLDAMVIEGCVQRDSSRRYLLGSRVFALAMRAVAGRQLTEVAHPFLVQLVREINETAVLGVLATDGRHGVYVDKVESSNPIRYAVDLGMQRELHCTALGKVLLAGFDDSKLKLFLSETSLERFTETTITSVRNLQNELQLIRKDGIAHNIGERVKDATGIAAPIFSSEGTVIAALLVAGPSQRMAANMEIVEKAVRRYATAITEVMGGPALNRTR